MIAQIDNLTSYMQWVQEQRGILAELNKYAVRFTNAKYDIFFRGVSDSDYDDIPSVSRDGLYCNEDVIFNEALSRNYGDFTADRTTFDMLVRMQHYSVPTRLLDITSDPLIALYFATKPSTNNSQNGKVIVYFVSKEKTFYSDSPEVCLHANLAREKDIFLVSDDDKDNLERLTRTASKENPECRDCDKYDLLNIYCVKPRMNNRRIILQKGAFLLFGQIVSKAFPPKVQPIDEIMKFTEIWSRFQHICGYANATTLKENGCVSELDEEIKNYDPIIGECWEWSKRHVTEKLGTDEFTGVYNCIVSDLKNRIISNLKTDFELLVVQSLLHSLHCSSATNLAEQSTERISRYAAMRDIFSRGGSIGKAETVVNHKTEISQELENYGITEESLFPELDVLGKSLREKYKCKDF